MRRRCEGGVDLGAQHLRPPVEPPRPRDPDLGGHQHFFPVRPQRAGQHLLVGAPAVEIRGVDERDAQVDRASDHVAVVRGQVHRAEAEAADPQFAADQELVVEVAPERGLAGPGRNRRAAALAREPRFADVGVGPQTAQAVALGEVAELADRRGGHAPAGRLLGQAEADFGGAVLQVVEVEAAQDLAVVGDQDVETQCRPSACSSSTALVVVGERGEVVVAPVFDGAREEGAVVGLEDQERAGVVGPQ